MMPSTYDRDRLAQAHRQDLLREAEHERLLAELPGPGRDTLSFRRQFKMVWGILRIRLQQGFQRRTA